ncbi:MAG: flagellar hook-basal body complex protein [Leptolinea sp.]|nr:flagellar hook-basal body complex protein [Leptolinea sp.]
MIRSMFTAINSMYLNQQYLDVVADNLSNVNTPGFKSSFVRFKDQFAQSVSVGGAPSDSLGGINPMQIGLGTNLGTIGKSFSQGALTSTGNDLDMAISGDGFFVYQHGEESRFFSRDGSLAIDNDGVLVHSTSGDRIQGWSVGPDGILDTTNMGDIQLPMNDTVARATTEANFLGNLDSQNTIPAETNTANLYGNLRDSDSTTTISFNVVNESGAVQNVSFTLTRVNPTTWTYNDPTYGTGTVIFDGIGHTTSSTNLSVGTNTVAVNWSEVRQTSLATIVGLTNHDGIEAGYYDVTMGVYDILGDLQTVALRFTRTTLPRTWSISVTPDPSDPTPPSLVNPDGTPLDPATPAIITFNDDGQYLSSNAIVSVPASEGARTPTIVNLDLTGMTMLATSDTVAMASQDGLAAGSLMGLTVSSNTGELYGAYSNGDQRLIGQLALATFINPAGLVRTGGNNFIAGLNSGEPNYGAAGTGGHGTIASGYIEGSNVDMSREFSNMILAQRGFQASSRIINASDEILQELVNLGR